ncbi:MAG: AAA family ATPase [Muribaculaceae bacterium]|nr:AAA family ATPase [Muribaculaceae bacterium]
MDFEPESNELLCEPEAVYSVNKELNLAWDIIEETGTNLYLTGRAGTGKTTFLKKLREKSTKNIVVLAPTGVAAINAHGTTIHSFFQFPLSPYLPRRGFIENNKKVIKINRLKRRIINSMSLLVIDEISMVRPDILDAIDNFLRRQRHSSRPFGGVQLLLIGDLRQLPPVVKEDEWNLLKDHYSSPYFYESQALKRAGYQSVELSMVYRQSDLEFLEMLNRIRCGKADWDTLGKLNRRFDPSVKEQDPEGYIRLTTHNRRADVINNSRLASIPGPEFKYEATIEGNFPESSFPAEKTLRLKEGAQVMFIKNDMGETKRFYNGMIGKISSISEEKIIVTPLNGGTPIEVTKMEWENNQFTINETDKTVVQEKIGSFSQYPLHLAWAITIHKSQGLTFDKAIIDAAYAFAPGQTYVALSRCRSLEGLILESRIHPNAVIIDPEISNFTNFCETISPDESGVADMKNKYITSLLVELFDFEPLQIALNDFQRAVIEHFTPDSSSLVEQLDDIKGKFVKEICDVSRKFFRSIQGRSIPEELASETSDLNERIQKGCLYFVNSLQEPDRFLKNLQHDMQLRDPSSVLLSMYDALMLLLQQKRSLLFQMAEKDFSIKEYLKAKSAAALENDTTSNKINKRKNRSNKTKARRAAEDKKA